MTALKGVLLEAGGPGLRETPLLSEMAQLPAALLAEPLGHSSGLPEKPLFLPPWRSVSMTESNFGIKSGGAWDGPHSTTGLSFLEFP